MVIMDFRKKDYYEIIKDVPFCNHISEQDILAIEQSKYSRTLIRGNKVVACFGLVERWQGRAEAWAMFAKGCTEYFLTIHRWVLSLVKHAPFDRIEAAIVADFKEGIRWIELLGFKKESGIMHKYFPDGQNAIMYARVR